MVQVKVTEGILEGERVKNEFGGDYYSFKGIPYAEPPLEDLRFQPPQPKTPWDGVRSAKEYGSMSSQYDVFTQIPNAGSEDCLYLNVFTPEIKPKTLLPVMFFIHGGGFVWGNGNDDLYGPEFLVRKEVILVTINYRLGILGYLCLDTKEIPGNAGMKDQVAALRWVQKNIKNFGGDPENVTIFGESAGGGSVGRHLLSPMTKGLFKRAIAQSGQAANWWTEAFEPREKALKLARDLGCDSEDDKELYEFFKSQPKEAFIKKATPVTFADKNRFDVDCSIASEQDFGQERYFYGDVHEVLKNGVHEGVDIMTGYVEHDGVIMFAPIFYDFEKHVYGMNNFLETLVPKYLARKLPIKEQLEIGRRMKKFYFDNKPVTNDSWEQMAKFLAFNVIVYETIDFFKYTQANKNTYLYKFTCMTERNVFGKIFQVESICQNKPLMTHCDDLAYLFPIKHANKKVEINSKEFKMIERVTELWTNFAKYGNPTPDSSLGVIWKPYNLQTQRYLNIGNELSLCSKPDNEEYQLWCDVFNQYLQKK